MAAYPKPAGRRLDGVETIDQERQRRCGGKSTPRTIRQTRYMIAAHGLPIVKRGRKIHSYTDWLDAWECGEQIEVDADQ